MNVSIDTLRRHLSSAIVLACATACVAVVGCAHRPRELFSQLGEQSKSLVKRMLPGEGTPGAKQAIDEQLAQNVPTGKSMVLEQPSRQIVSTNPKQAADRSGRGSAPSAATKGDVTDEKPMAKGRIFSAFIRNRDQEEKTAASDPFADQFAEPAFEGRPPVHTANVETDSSPATTARADNADYISFADAKIDQGAPAVDMPKAEGEHVAEQTDTAVSPEPRPAIEADVANKGETTMEVARENAFVDGFDSALDRLRTELAQDARAVGRRESSTAQAGEMTREIPASPAPAEQPQPTKIPAFQEWARGAAAAEAVATEQQPAVGPPAAIKETSTPAPALDVADNVARIPSAPRPVVVPNSAASQSRIADGFQWSDSSGEANEMIVDSDKLPVSWHEYPSANRNGTTGHSAVRPNTPLVVTADRQVEAAMELADGLPEDHDRQENPSFAITCIGKAGSNEAAAVPQAGTPVVSPGTSGPAPFAGNYRTSGPALLPRDGADEAASNSAAFGNATGATPPSVVPPLGIGVEGDDDSAEAGPAGGKVPGSSGRILPEVEWESEPGATSPAASRRLPPGVTIALAVALISIAGIMLHLRSGGRRLHA